MRITEVLIRGLAWKSWVFGTFNKFEETLNEIASPTVPRVTLDEKQKNGQTVDDSTLQPAFINVEMPISVIFISFLDWAHCTLLLSFS